MKSDRPMPTLATAAIDAPRRQAPAELHRTASLPPLDARRAAQPRLSCVVPCLNEADNLDALQDFDRAAWRNEVLGHEELFLDLHDRLPPEAVYERELLICRL